MNYSINKVDEVTFVHSINKNSPLDDLKELKKELRDFKGTVILDMMLIKGTFKRFFKTDNNFKNFEETDSDSYKEISCTFYKKNEHLLENSILSDSEKYKIFSGRLI